VHAGSERSYILPGQARLTVLQFLEVVPAVASKEK